MAVCTTEKNGLILTTVSITNNYNSIEHRHKKRNPQAHNKLYLIIKDFSIFFSFAPLV